MEDFARAAPFGRYCRRLKGADFSLEANTEATPSDGRFYLLRGGSVLLVSEDFTSVEAAYKALCREHWQQHLLSSDPAQRIASAWGLLGLDPQDGAAAAIITTEGTAADCKRLQQDRNRRRSEACRNARFRKPKTPTS
jgi:hypothetical protein